jgi:hypothetical protein
MAERDINPLAPEITRLLENLRYFVENVPIPENELDWIDTQNACRHEVDKLLSELPKFGFDPDDPCRGGPIQKYIRGLETKKSD